MFELQTVYGEIRLDDLFKEKVSKWLDGNPEYLKQIYKQVFT
jgi:two-component SAPR family response regulator